MLRTVIFAPLVLVGVTSALAQSTMPTTTKVAKPVKEKMICEDEEQLGSRLGGHRVCKTAAQWADERQQTRAMIDRSQTQRACSNGSAGC